MKAIPATPLTLSVVPRIIWFEPPEQALADPIRFMAYAMTYARHEDMKVIRQYVSDDDFREALDRAPPGIIDPRSWAYWNSKMGRYPAPPLPKRRFGDSGGACAVTGSDGEIAGARLSLDPEKRRKEGLEMWVKVRQEQPREDIEQARRRAREKWLAEFGPDKNRK
jgi:hypothetical protein